MKKTQAGDRAAGKCKTGGCAGKWEHYRCVKMKQSVGEERGSRSWREQGALWSFPSLFLGPLETVTPSFILTPNSCLLPPPLGKTPQRVLSAVGTVGD